MTNDINSSNDLNSRFVVMTNLTVPELYIAANGSVKAPVARARALALALATGTHPWLWDGCRRPLDLPVAPSWEAVTAAHQELVELDELNGGEWAPRVEFLADGMTWRQWANWSSDRYITITPEGVVTWNTGNLRFPAKQTSYFISRAVLAVLGGLDAARGVVSLRPL